MSPDGNVVDRYRGSRLPGIGSHQSARRESDEWWTPPEITDALGPFDLDPCAPEGGVPWITAEHYSLATDGLAEEWHGFVWLNPPYSEISPWMQRLADHGNGIALVFARTETRWWFDHVWPHASRFLFLAGRLSFHRPDGSVATHNAGGPSVLVAYGQQAADRLAMSGLAGAHLGPAGGPSPSMEGPEA